MARPPPPRRRLPFRDRRRLPRLVLLAVCAGLAGLAAEPAAAGMVPGSAEEEAEAAAAGGGAESKDGGNGYACAPPAGASSSSPLDHCYLTRRPVCTAHLEYSGFDAGAPAVVQGVSWGNTRLLADGVRALGYRVYQRIVKEHGTGARTGRDDKAGSVIDSGKDKATLLVLLPTLHGVSPAERPKVQAAGGGGSGDGVENRSGLTLNFNPGWEIWAIPFGVQDGDAQAPPQGSCGWQAGAKEGDSAATPLWGAFPGGNGDAWDDKEYPEVSGNFVAYGNADGNCEIGPSPPLSESGTTAGGTYPENPTPPAKWNSNLNLGYPWLNFFGGAHAALLKAESDNVLMESYGEGVRTRNPTGSLRRWTKGTGLGSSPGVLSSFEPPLPSFQCAPEPRAPWGWDDYQPTDPAADDCEALSAAGTGAWRSTGEGYHSRIAPGGMNEAEPGADYEGPYSARFDNLRPGSQVRPKEKDHPLFVNPQADPQLEAESQPNPKSLRGMFATQWRGLRLCAGRYQPRCEGRADAQGTPASAFSQNLTACTGGLTGNVYSEGYCVTYPHQFTEQDCVSGTDQGTGVWVPATCRGPDGLPVKIDGDGDGGAADREVCEGVADAQNGRKWVPASGWRRRRSECTKKVYGDELGVDPSLDRAACNAAYGMYFPEVPTCDSRQGADSPIQDFGDGTWGLRAGVPLFTRPSEEDGLAAVTGAFVAEYSDPLGNAPGPGDSVLRFKRVGGRGDEEHERKPRDPSIFPPSKSCKSTAPDIISGDECRRSLAYRMTIKDEKERHCYCEDAFDVLLTGGDWHVVNSTGPTVFNTPIPLEDDKAGTEGQGGAATGPSAEVVEKGEDDSAAGDGNIGGDSQNISDTTVNSAESAEGGGGEEEESSSNSTDAASELTNQNNLEEGNGNAGGGEGEETSEENLLEGGDASDGAIPSPDATNQTPEEVGGDEANPGGDASQNLPGGDVSGGEISGGDVPGGTLDGGRRRLVLEPRAAPADYPFHYGCTDTFPARPAFLPLGRGLVATSEKTFQVRWVWPSGTDLGGHFTGFVKDAESPLNDDAVAQSNGTAETVALLANAQLEKSNQIRARHLEVQVSVAPSRSHEEYFGFPDCQECAQKITDDVCSQIETCLYENLVPPENEGHDWDRLCLRPLTAHISGCAILGTGEECGPNISKRCSIDTEELTRRSQQAQQEASAEALEDAQQEAQQQNDDDPQDTLDDVRDGKKLPGGGRRVLSNGDDGAVQTVTSSGQDEGGEGDGQQHDRVAGPYPDPPGFPPLDSTFVPAGTVSAPQKWCNLATGPMHVAAPRCQRCSSSSDCPIDVFGPGRLCLANPPKCGNDISGRTLCSDYHLHEGCRPFFNKTDDSGSSTWQFTLDAAAVAAAAGGGGGADGGGSSSTASPSPVQVWVRARVHTYQPEGGPGRNDSATFVGVGKWTVPVPVAWVPGQNGEAGASCSYKVDECGVCAGSGLPAGFCDCAKTIPVPSGQKSGGSACATLKSLPRVADVDTTGQKTEQELLESAGSLTPEQVEEELVKLTGLTETINIAAAPRNISLCYPVGVWSATLAADLDSVRSSSGDDDRNGNASATFPCSGYGECVGEGRAASCACRAGFTGRLCATPVEVATVRFNISFANVMQNPTSFKNYFKDRTATALSLGQGGEDLVQVLELNAGSTVVVFQILQNRSAAQRALEQLVASAGTILPEQIGNVGILEVDRAARLSASSVNASRTALTFRRYVRQIVIKTVLEVVTGPANENSTDPELWKVLAAASQYPEELTVASQEALAAQTKLIFRQAEEEGRRVPNETIGLAFHVISDAEQALTLTFNEQQRQQQQQILSRGGQTVSPLAPQHSLEIIALNLVDSADAVSNTASTLARVDDSEGIGWDMENFDMKIVRASLDKVPENSTIHAGRGGAAVAFDVPSEVSSLLAMRATQAIGSAENNDPTFSAADMPPVMEMHAVHWDHNPFQIMEPLAMRAREDYFWADASPGSFSVASLRIRGLLYDPTGLSRSGIAMQDATVRDLKQPVAVKFPMMPYMDVDARNQIEENATDSSPRVELVCVWWDTSARAWSEKGCSPPSKSADGSDHMECACNHLTAFGIRMKNAGKKNTQILTQLSNENFALTLSNNTVALVFVVGVVATCILMIIFSIWFTYHRRKELEKRVMSVKLAFEASSSYLHDDRTGEGAYFNNPALAKRGSQDKDPGRIAAAMRRASLMARQRSLDEEANARGGNIPIVGLNGAHELRSNGYMTGIPDARIIACWGTIDVLLEDFAVDQGKHFVKRLERTMSHQGSKMRRRPSSLGTYVREHFGKSSIELEEAEETERVLVDDDDDDDDDDDRAGGYERNYEDYDSDDSDDDGDVVDLVNNVDAQARKKLRSGLFSRWNGDEKLGGEQDRGRAKNSITIEMTSSLPPARSESTVSRAEETGGGNRRTGKGEGIVRTYKRGSTARSALPMEPSSTTPSNKAGAGASANALESRHPKRSSRANDANAKMMSFKERAKHEEKKHGGWMYRRFRQSMKLEHEWLAPWFISHETAFYSMPSRFLVLACVILGQLVVESLVYDVRYPHLRQECEVYKSENNTFKEWFNYTYDEDGVVNGTLRDPYASDSPPVPIAGIPIAEAMLLSVVVAALSIPLPMFFFNINLKLAKSLRNERVFEFAGVVNLSKIAEYATTTCLVRRNGRLSDGTRKIVVRGSQGTTYLVDKDSTIDTPGEMTLCCATVVEEGENGPRLSAKMRAKMRVRSGDSMADEDGDNDDDGGGRDGVGDTASKRDQNKSSSLSSASSLSTSSVEDASFTLLVKNYEDELELYFATRAERDHWKSILDEVVLHALWTDAATMIEMETARGATRELKRRRAAIAHLRGHYRQSTQLASLLQRSEEWEHHAGEQREYVQKWSEAKETERKNGNGAKDASLKIETAFEERKLKETLALRLFKRRVMLEQALRDEQEEDLAAELHSCCRGIFNMLTSPYSHQLGPPLRRCALITLRVIMVVYILSCSFWLLLFSVCNGSEKTWSWVTSNFMMMAVSAIVVRPGSLLMLNVLIPACAAKVGRKGEGALRRMRERRMREGLEGGGGSGRRGTKKRKGSHRSHDSFHFTRDQDQRIADEFEHEIVTFRDALKMSGKKVKVGSGGTGGVGEKVAVGIVAGGAGKDRPDKAAGEGGGATGPSAVGVGI